MRPLPPVEDENLMRKNRACTPVTVRASPAVFVVVSMVWYSESTSAIAPCKTMLTAVGFVPKMVCQRTASPYPAVRRSSEGQTGYRPGRCRETSRC